VHEARAPSIRHTSTMVKQERNIHCGVCGKTYVDPTAAQNHARKHPMTRQPLVMVVPKPPATGGVQSAKNQSVTTPKGIGQVNPSSSQHPPPNQSAGERPNAGKTSLGKPQVTVLPKAGRPSQEQKARSTPSEDKVVEWVRARAKPEITCGWCPNSKFGSKKALVKHRTKAHPAVYQCLCSVVLDYKTMSKHLKVVHRESGRERRRKIMRSLRKKYTTAAKNNISAGPPVDPELSDEGEEGSSSDSDGG